MREACSVALAVWAATATVQAQVVTEMTPERIREAIAAGFSGSSPERYSLPYSLGGFSTPYSRVVAAAASARKSYLAFTEANATAEMLAPEVSVCALQGERALLSCPIDFRNIGSAIPVAVSTIVVLPRRSMDPARAIQPTEITPPVTKARCASFPLSVLSEENEIRIVYAERACCGETEAAECVVPFNLDGVK